MANNRDHRQHNQTHENGQRENPRLNFTNVGRQNLQNCFVSTYLRCHARHPFILVVCVFNLVVREGYFR